MPGIFTDRGVGENSQRRALCGSTCSICLPEHGSLLPHFWRLEKCPLYPSGRSLAPVGAERGSIPSALVARVAVADLVWRPGDMSRGSDVRF